MSPTRRRGPFDRDQQGQSSTFGGGNHWITSLGWQALSPLLYGSEMHRPRQGRFITRLQAHEVKVFFSTHSQRALGSLLRKGLWQLRDTLMTVPGSFDSFPGRNTSWQLLAKDCDGLGIFVVASQAFFAEQFCWNTLEEFRKTSFSAFAQLKLTTARFPKIGLYFQ